MVMRRALLSTLQSFSFEKAAVLNVAAKLNVSIRHFHGHVRKVKLANTTAGGHFTMPSRRGALSSCGEDDNAITVWTTEDAPDKAQKIVAASNADVPDAEVVVEAIHSYYWWDGKVHFDPEWRVAVTTVAPFETVKDAIGKVHSYDLPMMIYNLADVPDQHMYWKGIVQLSTHDATELAGKLVEQRVVACAQTTSTGLLAVKTVDLASRIWHGFLGSQTHIVHELFVCTRKGKTPQLERLSGPQCASLRLDWRTCLNEELDCRACLAILVLCVLKYKALVDASSNAAVAWAAIGGNEGYLKWLEDECIGVK
ncbi:unnamed protein product [Durusdinium trenchii]|uniref:Uncharacterized protein n=1 Tax=Durusdinium trenchii TaxID=1381693 RepID=A0ABP0SY45_9DINO